MTRQERLDKAIASRDQGATSNILRDIPRLAATDTPEGAERFARVVETNNSALVLLFIQHGANVNCCDATGEPMVCLAARKQATHSLAALAKARGCALNAMGPSRKTALDIVLESWSVSQSAPNMQSLLRSALPRESDTSFSASGGVPAVIMALHARPPLDTEQLKLIVRNAKNIECRDANGNTPFLLAMRSAEWSVAHTALQRGADLYAENDAGQDALAHTHSASTKAESLAFYKRELQRNIHDALRSARIRMFGTNILEREEDKETYLRSTMEVNRKGLLLEAAGADMLGDFFDAALWKAAGPNGIAAGMDEAQKLREALPESLRHRVRIEGLLREYETPREDSVTVQYMRGLEPAGKEK